MRKFRIILLCVLVVNVTIALIASAKGILPCMVYRHGLTNEQMDALLARHPNGTVRVTAQDWRAMRYQLHRFDCMTNYVHLIGSTQDCERVLLYLHDKAVELTSATNSFARIRRELEKARDEAAERAQEYADAYAAATNSLRAAIAEYTSASNRAARAEARHNAIVSWAEEQRDKVISPLTKAIWQAFIDRLKKEDD